MYIVDAYEQGSATGTTYHLLTSEHLTDQHVERYTVFIGNYDSGTGDGTVPACTYGLGVSAIKKDWRVTTRKGQMHGISIVTRGGFHGIDPDGDYSGTPGDSAAIVTNTVISDPDSFGAILEGVVFYAPGGVFTPGQALGLDCQIGAIEANGGRTGYFAAAKIGVLGDAFLAGSELGGAYGSSYWTNFLRYSPNLGSGNYDAFRVNQAGHIIMDNGPAASAPNNKKTVRVGTSGALEVVNNAGTAVTFSVDDNGNIHLPAGAGVYIGATKVL